MLLGFHFDEGNPGAFDNPFSLEAAIQLSSPGDVYWLKEGTYEGEFDFTRDGTELNPIIFRAVPEKKLK